MGMLLTFTLHTRGVGAIVEIESGGAASSYLLSMLAKLHSFPFLHF